MILAGPAAVGQSCRNLPRFPGFISWLKRSAYGVGPETLRNWLVKYREANGGTEADLTVSERARLKELEREVQELLQRQHEDPASPRRSL